MPTAPTNASTAAAAGDAAPLGPREVVRAIQEAFRAGDYARIAQLYDDDVDWLFHGPISIFPEVGHRRGKLAVFKSFEALNRLYTFERHVTDHLIADGEWVAGIADVTLVQRSSARTIHCRIGSFHRVRNGRLVEYRGFVDSFDAAEQVLGHELRL
jgi:ketosteroid isomerase-like protein